MTYRQIRIFSSSIKEDMSEAEGRKTEESGIVGVGRVSDNLEQSNRSLTA